MARFSDDERRAMSRVVGEIESERFRQVESEGWDAQHDDSHDTGELAVAAACYALYHSLEGEHHSKFSEIFPERQRPKFWPWNAEWWKPKNPRRDLIRAAALIVAEIERLDRAGERKAAQ